MKQREQDASRTMNTRRHLLLGAASLGTASVAGALAGCGGSAAAAEASPSRGTIVLVHGSFHGGWCWDRVKPLLQAAGYRVLAPTLTGLAHRSRYGGRNIGLGDHIDEMAQLLAFHDLTDVTLVGHSYGGMVISGVAEAQQARIRGLVYLDAFVPEDGNAAFDFLPPGFADDWLALARTQGGGWGVPPPPAAAFGVTESADVAWVQPRLTPMPYQTHAEPIRLPTAAASRLARLYLWCSRSGLLDQTAQRIRVTPGWSFDNLDTAHDAMVTLPAQLAARLLEAAKMPRV